ncbi:MAG: nucleoside triphosphate hydrolase [Tatlockia sp.]|nr:nucleoside triphosphate hydrolase [Tatlockia sp.]
MNLLDKIVKLENEATGFGFQWETTAQIMEQIKSECIEVEEHLNSNPAENQAALQEELGDLLHAVFSLCVFCKLDPEETLTKTCNKFELRLNEVKLIAEEKKLANLNGMPFKDLMDIWEEAKSRLK